MVIRRGEIWWAKLWPKRRPVLVLTRPEALGVRAMVTICPLTRKDRGIPSQVRLGPAEGLPEPCVANADDLRTIPRAAFECRICSLSPVKLDQVAVAIHFALALDCPGTLGQTDIIAS